MIRKCLPSSLGQMLLKTPINTPSNGEIKFLEERYDRIEDVLTAYAIFETCKRPLTRLVSITPI